jgi:hypothetical protein
VAIESLPTFTKSARQRWESIPADIRQRLLSNVWCGQCLSRSDDHQFQRHHQGRRLAAGGQVRRMPRTIEKNARETQPIALATEFLVVLD